MFPDDFTALEHAPYMHYELWDEIKKKKKKCIKNYNQNEVSDCLRIKTMLSKTFTHTQWLIQSVVEPDWQLTCVCFLFL